ncbi:MAG: hypothetical protein Q9218_006900 [Villophora microphyllina]
MSLQPGEQSRNDEYYLGRRLSYKGALCTVRYIGEVDGTRGQWLGVEWDDPARGKHDGSHKGKRYFECLGRVGQGAAAASFLRFSSSFDQPQTFSDAVRAKYGSSAASADEHLQDTITISGKQVDEVGFDIIAQKQSTWSDLEIVSLEGLRITGFSPLHRPITPADPSTQGLPKNSKCKELDLSNNLFESWADIVDICHVLEELETLKVKYGLVQLSKDTVILITFSCSGNRFESFSPEADNIPGTFKRLRELSLANTALGWKDVLTLCHQERFPVLRSLSLAFNPLGHLPLSPRSFSTNAIRRLDLSFCNIRTLHPLACVTSLSHLDILILRSNPLTTLSTDHALIFSDVSTLDLTSTSLPTLATLNPLPFAFPILSSLQTTNTPLATSHPSARLLTIARLPSLSSLNHTNISKNERQDAELYYLYQITTSLLNAKTAEEEEQIRKEHPLWKHLCKKHGEPDSIARKHDKKDNAPQLRYPPVSLGPNLIKFTFVHHYTPIHGGDQTSSRTATHVRELPKSIDVYRLKSIVGPLFAMYGMDTQLIFETDEWDPVPTTQLGGLDWGSSDDDEDSDDVLDISGGWEGAETEDASADLDEASEAEALAEKTRKKQERVERKKKQWVKREIEIEDSTRPIGDWIEAKEARVRVERREIDMGVSEEALSLLKEEMSMH